MSLRSHQLTPKNIIPARSLVAQVTASVLLLAQGIMLVPHATAETLARAHGRCKLTSQSSGQSFTVFDGHCITKQKQQGGTTIFAIELDNGSKYNFFGPNKQALQVQAYDGVHNVQFTEDPDKGVFVWQESGNRNRLSVKLDTQHSPNVSHDNPTPPSTEQIVGTAIGALIGGLLSGGKPAQQPSRPPATAAAQPAAGTTVASLSDLIGAKGGQAENTVIQRGYRFVKSNPSGDSVYSYWLESQTNYCVTIRTEQGRYQSIVYAGNSFDCQK